MEIENNIMKNINFFNINRFETLIETNSTYLFDCLILFGLDKKVLQNMYVVDLIVDDFKKNYNIFFKYPKDSEGRNIPFNVYDLKDFFKFFVDNEGNYSRCLNNESVTLKVLDKNNYEVTKRILQNGVVKEVKRKYVDNLEMERCILVKNGLNIVYKELSYRNDDIVTFNNIIEFENVVQKNRILILPENINTLDSGFILKGTSKEYSKDKDFRNYSSIEKDAIVDAIFKIYKGTSNSDVHKTKQKILL